MEDYLFIYFFFFFLFWNLSLKISLFHMTNLIFEGNIKYVRGKDM